MPLVRLVPVGSQYAELGFAGSTSHVNLDSVLVALVEGSDGDLINIETIGDAGLGEGVTFEVSGYDIVCHFEDGVSTVADFEAALAADPSVAALCEVDQAGTAAAVLTDADDTQPAAFFSGGGGVASQAAPSTSTDGKVMSITPLRGTVFVKSCAGSGTMTATVNVYAYHPDFADWFLIKKLNAGSAIAETGTDLIRYAEEVTGLYGFTRIAASLSSAGTGQLIEVWVKVPPLALS